MLPPARPEGKGPPIRVMVVEDEAIVALDLQTTLGAAGFQVVGVSSTARDALDRAAALHPDVVLMDIRLEGEMDGVDAARQLHTRHAIPVVFLTAHADEATLARARLAKAYGYLVKPYDPAAVRAQVETAHFRRLAEEERERVQAIQKKSLQEDVARLREIDDLRTRFVGAASHELSTPITAIQLSLSVLRRSLEAQLGQSQIRSFDIVDRNIGRLAELVKDLLDSAKVQSSRLGLQYTGASMTAVVAAVVDVFRAQAASRDLAIELRSPGSNDALVDVRRVTQVLTNLLDNAIKFTDPGGRIDVTVRSTADEVVVDVEDTGRGLDAQQIGRLFQPFGMVHDPSTTQGKGTGLGLYVSRGIARAHGGELECHSAGPGTGTRFTLSLPLRPAHLAPGTPATGHEPPMQEGRPQSEGGNGYAGPRGRPARRGRSDRDAPWRPPSRQGGHGQ